VLSEERDSARLAPHHEGVSFFGVARDRRFQRVAILDELDRSLDEAKIFRQREQRSV